MKVNPHSDVEDHEYDDDVKYWESSRRTPYYYPILCNMLFLCWICLSSGNSAIVPESYWYFRHSRLFVSELHIPGYVQSKVPFLADDSTLLLQRPRSYTSSDYHSFIPYQDDHHLVHTTVDPLFTYDECNAIVQEAEHIASEIAWTTNRHGNFPTTDLPLAELPTTLSFLRMALQERIYPLLQQQFGPFMPDATKLCVADGFVVKYDATNGQKELKPHRDGSVLSFNIALNPSTAYTGGGTWFASLDEPVTLEQGHLVSHASALLHGGHGITLVRGISWLHL